MGIPKVVNIKHCKCDVYVGRNSIFSSPYIVGRDGDLDMCISLYKVYFYDRIEKDSAFRDAVGWLEKLLQQGDVILGCYCKPMKCHGDVIAEYLSNRVREVKE